MVNAIRRFVKEEEGAAAAEYAMLLALITLGIITAMTLLATNIGIAITDAANKIVAPS
jgi:pilus assembly protein Flp/PilA